MAAGRIGVIGSTRTTNEENYLLFRNLRASCCAPTTLIIIVLPISPLWLLRSRGHKSAPPPCASVYCARHLLIAATHRRASLLAYNIRNNVRLHRARSTR